MPATRRVGPDGETVLVDLAGRPFGAGPRRCPGEAHAPRARRGPRDERVRRPAPPGELLVLPNAWDHASAAALADAGFPAVGTTSLGVAAALGLPDGAAETAEATIDLARRLTHLPVPVTMDIENGFSARSRRGRGLRRPARPGRRRQPRGPAHRPGALRAGARRRHRPHGSSSTPASTPTGWATAASTRRSRAPTHYIDAGADGIFVPGVKDEAEIARLAEALPVPLNVLFLPGLSVPRLAELGVARISTGSLLYRVALGAAIDAAAIRPGRRPGSSAARRPTRPSTPSLAPEIVSTILPRTWPSSSSSCAAAACSSGKVAEMCGRRPPSWTSGVMCSPRS